jgi:hypothetical protein
MNAEAIQRVSTTIALDSAGHFGDPALVVTAFDNMDFSERRPLGHLPLRGLATPA